MSVTRYPDAEWERVSPAEAGMDAEKLARARRWLDEHTNDPLYRESILTFHRFRRTVRLQGEETGNRYRVVVVRHGAVVAEWNNGVDPLERLPLFSATKSVYSSLLGCAIAEGRISSVDAKMVGYYPELMNVPPGAGPKPGRHVFEKDRDITFRQVISNTSGYMKPGEEPGRVFHYQTFGMNIITHAIAKSYGLYDIRYPGATPGFEHLVDEKIGKPIGARWHYVLRNFDLPREARSEVFGNYTDILSTTRDMARLGWLWCNWGRWKGKQLIPEAWLRDATHTAPDIRANCPQEQWKYGYAFWTNDHGQLLPGLPRDSYVAAGNYGIALIWVCPGLDLVVAHNPGLLLDKEEEAANRVAGFLQLIVDACA